MTKGYKKTKKGTGILATVILGTGIIAGANFIIKSNSEEVKFQREMNKAIIAENQTNGSGSSGRVEGEQELVKVDLNSSTMVPETEGVSEWVQYSFGDEWATSWGSTLSSSMHTGTAEWMSGPDGDSTTVEDNRPKQTNAWLNFRIIDTDVDGQVKYGLGLVFDNYPIDENGVPIQPGGEYIGPGKMAWVASVFNPDDTTNPGYVLPSDHPLYNENGDAGGTNYQNNNTSELYFANSDGYVYDGDGNKTWDPNAGYGDIVNAQSNDSGISGTEADPDYMWKTSSVENVDTDYIMENQNFKGAMTFSPGLIEKQEDWPFDNDATTLFGQEYYYPENHVYFEFSANEGDTETWERPNHGVPVPNGIYPGFFNSMGTNQTFILTGITLKGKTNYPENIADLKPVGRESSFSNRDEAIYLGYPNPELKVVYKGFQGNDFVVELQYDHTRVSNDFSNVHAMTYEFYGPDQKGETAGSTLWDEIIITDDPTNPVLRKTKFVSDDGVLDSEFNVLSAQASQYAKDNGWVDGTYDDVTAGDESNPALNSPNDNFGAANDDAVTSPEFKNGDINIAYSEEEGGTGKLNVRLTYKNVYYLDQSVEDWDGSNNYQIKVNTYSTSSNLGWDEGYISTPILDEIIEFPILSEAEIPYIIEQPVITPNSVGGEISATVSGLKIDLKTNEEDTGIDTTATRLASIDAIATPIRFGVPSQPTANVWEESSTWNATENNFESQITGDGILTIPDFEVIGLNPNTNYTLKLIFHYSASPNGEGGYATKTIESFNPVPFTTPSRGKGEYEVSSPVNIGAINIVDEKVSTKVTIDLLTSPLGGATHPAYEYLLPEVTGLRLNGTGIESLTIAMPKESGFYNESENKYTSRYEFYIQGMNPNTTYSDMSVDIDYEFNDVDIDGNTISESGTENVVISEFTTPSLGLNEPTFVSIETPTMSTNESQEISANGQFVLGNITDGSDGYTATQPVPVVSVVDEALQPLDPAKIIIEEGSYDNAKHEQVFNYTLNDLSGDTNYTISLDSIGYGNPEDLLSVDIVDSGATITFNSGPRGDMNIQTGTWDTFSSTNGVTLVGGKPQLVIDYAYTVGTGAYDVSEFNELYPSVLKLELTNNGEVVGTPLTDNIIVTQPAEGVGVGVGPTISGQAILDDELLGLNDGVITDYKFGLQITSTASNSTATSTSTIDVPLTDIITGVTSPTVTEVNPTSMTGATAVAPFTRDVDYEFTLDESTLEGNNAGSQTTAININATDESGNTTNIATLDSVTTPPTGNVWTFTHLGANTSETYTYSADITYSVGEGKFTGEFETTETKDLGSFDIPGAGVDALDPTTDITITSASADNKSLTLSYKVENANIPEGKDDWTIKEVFIADIDGNKIATNVADDGSDIAKEGSITVTGIKPGTQLADIAAAGYTINFNAYNEFGTETTPGSFDEYNAIETVAIDETNMSHLVDVSGNLIGSPDQNGEFMDLQSDFSDAINPIEIVSYTDTTLTIRGSINEYYRDLIYYDTNNEFVGVFTYGSIGDADFKLLQKGIDYHLISGHPQSGEFEIEFTTLTPDTTYNLNELRITFVDIYFNKDTYAEGLHLGHSFDDQNEVIDDQVFTTLPDLSSSELLDLGSTSVVETTKNSITLSLTFDEKFLPYVQNGIIDMNEISFTYGATRVSLIDYTIGDVDANGTFEVTFNGLKKKTEYDLAKLQIYYAGFSYSVGEGKVSTEAGFPWWILILILILLLTIVGAAVAAVFFLMKNTKVKETTNATATKVEFTINKDSSSEFASTINGAILKASQDGVEKEYKFSTGDFDGNLSIAVTGTKAGSPLTGIKFITTEEITSKDEEGNGVADSKEKAIKVAGSVITDPAVLKAQAESKAEKEEVKAEDKEDDDSKRARLTKLTKANLVTESVEKGLSEAEAKKATKPQLVEFLVTGEKPKLNGSATIMS